MTDVGIMVTACPLVCTLSKAISATNQQGCVIYYIDRGVQQIRAIVFADVSDVSKKAGSSGGANFNENNRHIETGMSLASLKNDVWHMFFQRNTTPDIVVWERLQSNWVWNSIKNVPGTPLPGTEIAVVISDDQEHVFYQDQDCIIREVIRDIGVGDGSNWQRSKFQIKPDRTVFRSTLAATAYRTKGTNYITLFYLNRDHKLESIDCKDGEWPAGYTGTLCNEMEMIPGSPIAVTSFPRGANNVEIRVYTIAQCLAVHESVFKDDKWQKRDYEESNIPIREQMHVSMIAK